MKTRIALLGIFVENKESTPQLNAYYMNMVNISSEGWVPNAKEETAVISIVMDAPETVINALAGKIGMLPHVSVQTMYSKF